MPIYEYGCKKCGKTFEYMQRMSDSPKRKCEACGANALERLISQTSFHLKGGGWYKDLYSSPKPGSEGSSDSGSSSGGSSDSSSSSGGSSDSSSSSGSSSGADASSSTASSSKSKAGSSASKPAKKAKKTAG